ncbi:unnamed protein product [Clonostachys rosea]|uniref:Uncharacterized protein n=1 Tax=Bionectria ochroleuca TaxID=29856 RepID=A0ABY6U271_BIOOC|nr:unnamed protein product [Clonostachys rosea]
MASHHRRPLVTKERLAAISAMGEDEFVHFVLDHLKRPGKCVVTDFSAWKEDLTTDEQQNFVQKFRQVADRMRQFDHDRFDNSMERIVRDSTIDGLDRIYNHQKTESYRGPAALSPDEIELERWHHTKLLEEGGRPIYHIDDLDEVAKNPEMKYHVTSPWQYYEASFWKHDYADGRVFCKQHDHWTSFRVWANTNRNRSRRGSTDKRLEVEVGDWTLASRSLRWYQDRAFQNFDMYQNTVFAILRQYGVPRPDTLKIRAKDQDKLTTWQEYVGFMYLHLGWARQELRNHRDNGEEFLDGMRRDELVPEGTTLEQLQSMFFDAWVRAPFLEIDVVRRRLQQQRELLVERLEAADDDDAKAALKSEIDLLDRNYEKNERRQRMLKAKCWELSYTPYESDWPWCIAARKVYCYEKLAVWARDQISLIRAELEGKKSCLKCPAQKQTPAATDQTGGDATPNPTTPGGNQGSRVPFIAAVTGQTGRDDTPCPTTSRGSQDLRVPLIAAATNQTRGDATPFPTTPKGHQESGVPLIEDSPVAPHNPSLGRTYVDQAVQVEISTDLPPTAAAPQPGSTRADPSQSRKRKRDITPAEAPRRSQRVASLKVKKDEEAAAAAREESEQLSQLPAKSRKTKAATKPKPKPKPAAAPKSKAKSKSKKK